jgi:NAD-dependent DNA ligase
MVTDKMDGISCQLVYNNQGRLQVAYSRGDGIMGQDITRHVKHIPDVPQKVSGKMIVRAEIEFANSTFNKIRKSVTRSGGQEFKNARNAVAGLMNAKTTNVEACKNMSLIVYEIMDSDESKYDQLNRLEANNFNVVYWEEMDNLTDDKLEKYIKKRKNTLDYDIDGIVVEVQCPKEKKNLNEGNDSLNPKHAIKYKIPDEALDVKVLGVTWNVSKHGLLKPIVNLEPTEIGGVTVSNATGFNAKFIVDNGIGKGAVIKLVRSGDVIPYINGFVKKSKPDLPSDITYEWNETEVEFVTLNFDDNDTILIKQIESWASSLEIDNLKEKTVAKLVEHGLCNISVIVESSEDVLVDIVGKNGSKIYKSIGEKLDNVELHVLLGSHPCFGQGLGKRKFKHLIPALGKKILNYLSDKSDTPSINEICAVDGFEEKTAIKVIEGLQKFKKEFWSESEKYITIAPIKTGNSGGILANKKVCMTGFRDKDLQGRAEELGATLQSSVSGNTSILVCMDKNSTSGKTKKARDLGVEIMSKKEFEELVK